MYEEVETIDSRIDMCPICSIAGESSRCEPSFDLGG